MPIISHHNDVALGSLGRLSSAKRLLALSTTTYDNYLKQMLINSSRVFEVAVKRQLRMQKFTEYRTMQDGGTRLYSRQYPIYLGRNKARVIPSIADDSSAVVSFDLLSIAGNSYWNIGTSKLIGSNTVGFSDWKFTNNSNIVVDWRSLDGKTTKKTLVLKLDWEVDNGLFLDDSIESPTAAADWCQLNIGRKFNDFNATLTMDGVATTLTAKTEDDKVNSGWPTCKVASTTSKLYPTATNFLIQYCSQPIDTGWYYNDSPFTSTKMLLYITFPIGYWGHATWAGSQPTDYVLTPVAVDPIVLKTGVAGTVATKVYGADYKVLDERFILYPTGFSTTEGDVMLEYYAGYDTTGWDTLDDYSEFGVPADIEMAIVEDACIQTLKKIGKDDNLGAGMLGLSSVNRGGESFDYESFVEGYHSRMRAAIRYYRGYAI